MIFCKNVSLIISLKKLFGKQDSDAKAFIRKNINTLKVNSFNKYNEATTIHLSS